MSVVICEYHNHNLSNHSGNIPVSPMLISKSNSFPIPSIMRYISLYAILSPVRRFWIGDAPNQALIMLGEGIAFMFPTYQVYPEVGLDPFDPYAKPSLNQVLNELFQALQEKRSVDASSLINLISQNYTLQADATVRQRYRFYYLRALGKQLLGKFNEAYLSIESCINIPQTVVVSEKEWLRVRLTYAILALQNDHIDEAVDSFQDVERGFAGQLTPLDPTLPTEVMASITTYCNIQLSHCAFIANSQQPMYQDVYKGYCFRAAEQLSEWLEQGYAIPKTPVISFDDVLSVLERSLSQIDWSALAFNFQYWQMCWILLLKLLTEIAWWEAKLVPSTANLAFCERILPSIKGLLDSYPHKGERGALAIELGALGIELTMLLEEKYPTSTVFPLLHATISNRLHDLLNTNTQSPGRHQYLEYYLRFLSYSEEIVLHRSDPVYLFWHVDPNLHQLQREVSHQGLIHLSGRCFLLRAMIAHLNYDKNEAIEFCSHALNSFNMIFRGHHLFAQEAQALRGTL